MVVPATVGVHSQSSLAVDKTSREVPSEEVDPDSNSLILAPPSNLPIEDSRQGSLNMEHQLKESSTTMPSSSSDLNPANSGNINDDGKEGAGYGRDSPPAQKVRFSEGTTLFRESSQSNMPVSIQPPPAGEYSPHPYHHHYPPRPPSSDDAPSPSILITNKSKYTSSNTNTPNNTIRPSVFERLSKTETVASMHQKFLPNEQQHGRRIKRSTSAPPSLRSKASRQQHDRRVYKKSNNSKNNNKPKKRQIVPADAAGEANLAEKIVQIASSFDLFERLAEKHTALSKSRRRERSDANNRSRRAKRKQTNTKLYDRKRSSSLGRRPSHFDREGDQEVARARRRRERRNRKAEEALEDAFSISSAGPPLEIEFSSRMKLVCSSKFMPEDGFEELDPFELGLNSSFTEYEAGTLSPKDFAAEIMTSLLWRDLPPDIKWEVRKPLERELAMPIGEIGYSFMIEASGRQFADEDDEDEESQEEEDEEGELYVASATGNVTFLPDREIQVENYSCVHDVAE
mmetsp:Transcript_26529/g.39772  ORF Transcript_26529/g.39772 Transcript_26529/m.39772 type:complete len:514 (-) Transcript_26529:105-1646(-)|eukprot:CAMPEP_0203662592 /NCGR_PEP_ID=MMETSP0090-20130426/506_1 /ASSEMBLY_ACC=CAM_ASM_001088 /TAXON_ID=426623 /ORGANISM="Chaetoceros affinis, Strain CCMP159" /LENGTH=513 /DNA_ID=CAMNT_0050525405 /DNA_START=33 /DNA_END=1574 /DNA_ORIENTATION=+